MRGTSRFAGVILVLVGVPMELFQVMAGPVNDHYHRQNKNDEGRRRTQTIPLECAHASCRYRTEPVEDNVEGIDNIFNRPTTSIPTMTAFPTSSPRPTQTGMPTITSSPSNSPTVTATPSLTPVPTITSSPSVTPFPSATPRPTQTALPTVTPTPTTTTAPSIGPTVTAAPTVTAIPTVTASPTMTGAPTVTASPTITALPTTTASPTMTTVPSTSPTITAHPTQTPMPTVTGSPTITAAPTVTTSPTISASPTITASPTTTRIPSAVPTITASPTITTMPTMTASPTMTTIPSASPTITATPTISNAPTTTTEPTTFRCTVDAAGTFGSSTGSSQDLQYFYAMEVQPNTSQTVANDQLAVTVELAIINDLLPLTFPEQCAPPTSTRRQRRRRLAVNGISVVPPDLVLAGISCPGVTNDCFIVDARLTLFGTNIVNETAMVRDTVMVNMDSGMYNTADVRILNLRFLNQTAVDQLEGGGGGNPNPGPPPPNPLSDGGNRIPVYGWVLIVVGSVLLMAMLCACPNPCGTTDPYYDDDDEDDYIDHRETLLVHDHEYNDFETNDSIYPQRSMNPD